VFFLGVGVGDEPESLVLSASVVHRGKKYLILFPVSIEKRKNFSPGHKSCSGVLVVMFR
jgi:hypothetical protein